jgi:hypothetical protein
MRLLCMPLALLITISIILTPNDTNKPKESSKEISSTRTNNPYYPLFIEHEQAKKSVQRLHIYGKYFRVIGSVEKEYVNGRPRPIIKTIQSSQNDSNQPA